MAKDSKRVIDETIGAFKELKEQIKAYKDELATLKVGSEQWTQTAQKLANAQKQVNAINQAAKGNLVAYDKEQANSINQLKQLIKLKNQERNAMDMSSKEYQEATKELKVLNDKLREAGTSAGDWRANVGNYAGSIKDALGELGSAAQGVSGNILGLNTSMLKLAGNPLGAAILGITTAISALAKGIKSSEENTNRWNAVLSPLKATMTVIEKALQGMASKFLDFAESLRQSESAGKIIQGVLTAIMTVVNQNITRITNLRDGIKGAMSTLKPYVEKLMEWGGKLKESLSPVTEFVSNVYDSIKQKLNPVIDWIVEKYNQLARTNMGKILGLQEIQQVKESFEKAKGQVQEFSEEVSAVTQSYDKIARMEAALLQQRRASAATQAKLQGEIADAQEKYQEAMNNKDWVAAQEQLNVIGEKNKKLAADRVALAAAEYNLIKAKNALSDSDTKALDEEAAAYANLVSAQGSLAESNRTLLRQQKQLNNQMEADKKAQEAAALAEAVKKLNAELKNFDSEYANTLAKLKEPIAPEGAEIDTNSLNAYYDAIKANNEAEYQAYVDLTEKKIAELERFIEAQKAAGQDVTTQELQLAALRKEQAEGYVKQYEKMIDSNTKADKKRAKELTALQRSEIKGYADLFDSVSGMFEQNTIAYKATATAKALINTYLAATGAFADTPGGPIARGIAMAATLAAGIAQVMQIWKTDIKNPSVGNATSTTPSIAEPSVVEPQPFTYTRTAQTFEEEEKLNQPLFVSVTDINNVQNKVRVTEENNTW